MSLYRDEAVVLRTMRLGEADRIVSMLTAEHGKVRAVAKGVRRTTSKFGGRLEPLHHVSMLCWKGRELDIVNQAEVLESFRTVREDLSRVSKAFTVLEVADQLAQEQHPSARLFHMVLGALRALDRDDSAMFVAGFLLKALVVEGSAPMVDRCAGCGEDAQLVAFDLIEGGALCRDCRRGLPLSGPALELVRRVLGGGLAGALEEPASATVDEVTDLATRAMEVHLDRRLRSVRSGPAL
ncbi:MAG: DNA repair protein RecO [Acidimicrobiales bacterium]